MFLWVRGLKDYNIKWTSINTLNININADRVIEFNSLPYIKNNQSMKFFSITKFVFNSK